MAAHPQRFDAVTLADVMHDLETGRSIPLRPIERRVDLSSLPRPALGGPVFLAVHLIARLLGRIHPRLARRALLRLWVTPWVHPSTRRPLTNVADDLQTWRLTTADHTMRGYCGGRGPTVVLVHGWAGRAADWRHLATALIAAGWRVVAPDLPAHGMTTGRTTDLFELSSALATVLDHERPSAVVTHSLGFPITMLAREAGAAIPPRWVALAPGRKMSHALTRFGARARLRPALVTELRRAMEIKFGDDIWGVLDTDRVVPDLTADGLVIHDADDHEVSIDDGRHIGRTWPGAHVVETSGLGHRRILRDDAVVDRVVRALG